MERWVTAVTVRITGGQSVKIETTGRHIELKANHRWVKCDYPYYYYCYYFCYGVICVNCDVCV